MTEAFLQYVWQHQLLQGELVTTDGLPVVVERPGVLNHDAGPDFFDARVRIGDTLWAGNLEVHVKSSDWNLHRHTNDRAYDNVVLHVVYQCDTPVTLHDCRQLPTLELRRNIADALWDNYDALQHPPAEMPIPCMDHLPEVPSFYIDSCLERLTLERLERKCATVRQMLHDARGGWEQTCYWIMAHYFGGKVNALPFELLAKNTDLNLLSRWRDNPQRIEALLMGQAGMLEGYFDDEYPRQLQRDYEALRQGACLEPMKGFLWKFYRLRPNGFPTIRISQFAQMVCQSRNLFSHLLETTDAVELQKFFDVSASSYWNTHYRFDQPSSGTTKRLGESFVNTLIINAWVPLLFEYGNQNGQQQYKDQAVSILQQLPPEKNRIIRQWQAAGVKALNADQSQALLQLYNEHCASHDCLHCQIGYKIITH
ncbi:MAG: DUF2851 family protein [Bacteroidales bacterium]|nr:DUF2851 family protein [Bacteroidales bacterium]